MATKLQHGEHTITAALDIVQHKYMTSIYDYVELLEITNPPEDKLPFVVIHHNLADGYRFCETETLAVARAAFDRSFGPLSSVFKQWKGLGIAKIYHGQSILIEPWCYYGANKKPFGTERQFVSSDLIKQLTGTVTIDPAALIIHKKSIWIDTLFGISNGGYHIWHSGRISESSTVRIIDGLQAEWHSQYAISMWLTFVGQKAKKDIKLAIDPYTIKLSFQAGSKYLILVVSITDEQKRVLACGRWEKSREEFSHDLIYVASLFDVLKFFMQ